MSTIARRFLAGLLVVALGVSVAACGSDESANVRVVSPEAAHQLLTDDPAITLIDVRTPEEYAAGHLEGAQLINLQAPDFGDRIAELDRDGSYVIYCRSGNRSAQARTTMEDLGFTDVADIDGGILAWMDAGLPVVTD